MAFKKLKLWFDAELAQMLADKIESVKPEFKTKAFVKDIDSKVDEHELKARVELIADELYTRLGENYKKGLSTLLKILGPENELETGMFTEYYWVMPIAKFIEKYGMDDFAISMKAIEEITKRNTGEYTIRPFIEKYTDKTLKQMKVWSLDENKHVRRLACEGLRPRLPWATKLDMFIQDPRPILPILENLKDDGSKYVQKSVANCINDLLKDNIEIAKALLEDWNGQEISKQRKWIIKHALRNLLKQKDSWALGMV